MAEYKYTLAELCSMLAVEIPDKFTDIAHEKQTVVFRSNHVEPGDICVFIRSAEELRAGITTAEQYRNAVEREAKLIFMGREAFHLAGLKEEDYPVILIDHPHERISNMFRAIRSAQQGKVVMISGSVGKTTTKDMCSVMMSNHFDTFYNVGNSNTPHQIIRFLSENLNHCYEVYIQEAGAGYLGSVQLSAEMLRPDIYILTNVLDHHMKVFRTPENMFREKVSPDDYVNDDGIIITNYDDKRIREHHFSHKVISFAVDCDEVDYKAVDIRQDMNQLKFDIIENATGERTSVKINILGAHNVYNALAAFALGRTLGIPAEIIRDDLFEYRTEGIRQVLKNIGGVYINMDCYNVAEESIDAMLKAGADFPLAGNGKRIAILGGENKLGKDVRERSRAYGEHLGNVKLDKILFCGTAKTDRKALNWYGDAKDVMYGFRKASPVPNMFSTHPEHISSFLKTNVKENDLVMFKGIYHLNMPVAVDKVFGTSFSFQAFDPTNSDVKMICCNEPVDADIIYPFDMAQINNIKPGRGTLNIPDKVEGYSVFRIANRAFSGRKDFKEIVFGNSLLNIGEGAFANCTSLRRVNIPGNVKVIEEKAFEGCSRLTTVIIQDGVKHISEKAFADCPKLKLIVVPPSVRMIEDDILEESDACKIRCIRDSFVHRYVLDNGLRAEIVEESEADRLNEVPQRKMILTRSALGGEVKAGGDVKDVSEVKKNKKLDPPFGAAAQVVTDKGIRIYWENTQQSDGSEIYRSYSDNETGELAMIVHDKFFGIWIDNVFDKEYRKIYYKIRNFKYQKDGTLLYSDFSDQLVVTYINEMEIEQETVYMHSESSRQIRALYGWGEVADAVWSTSDKSVATVDKKGFIRGISQGECFLYCESKSLNAEKKARVIIDRPAPEPLTEISSRYHNERETGIWKSNDSSKENDATIMITGDMMCGMKQIEEQYDESEGWNFNRSFDFVKEVTDESDFTIGSLQADLDPARSYMTEEMFIGTNSNYNAPPRYLDAIKHGGFDGVIITGSHRCDAEELKATIDQIEKYKLAHTGTFEDKQDKSFMIVEIKGIKVGFLAYTSSQIEDNGKNDDISQEGEDALLNVYSEEKVKTDVKDCRDAGAEFIIVYMHWEKKNYKYVTHFQKKRAVEAAEAGADIIIGSNSRIIEKYDLISFSDGRKVPCFYSIGNFHARKNHVVGSGDSIIAKLRLCRNESGEVYLKEQTYIPFFTYKSINGAFNAPVSVSDMYNEVIKKFKRKEKYDRIKKRIGNKIKLCDDNTPE